MEEDVHVFGIIQSYPERIPIVASDHGGVLFRSSSTQAVRVVAGCLPRGCHPRLVVGPKSDLPCCEICCRHFAGTAGSPFANPSTMNDGTLECWLIVVEVDGRVGGAGTTNLATEGRHLRRLGENQT